MPTITVTAPDSAMAMDEVVRQLGSDAYILSTSQQDGLVQIKASLDPLNSSPRRPNENDISRNSGMCLPPVV